MKNSEEDIIKIEFDGLPFEIHISHEECLGILRSEEISAPKIPPGCNTVEWFFRKHTGEFCMGINQSGFARELSDNEQQVNGITLIICLDSSLDEESARARILRLLEKINKA